MTPSHVAGPAVRGYKTSLYHLLFYIHTHDSQNPKEAKYGIMSSFSAFSKTTSRLTNASWR
jgi:hypothetical protein